ncbi:MAG: XTP/dITP diphosphatase [Gammaproteobacteria bacterium]
MTRIVLASGNHGKVRELEALLMGSGHEISPQSEFDIGEVEETGLTFIENAILKARHASRHTGLPAIADDSGLEVDALNGAPGIMSARYAGTHGADEDNNRKLLTELAKTANDERTARFQCAVVFMRHATDAMPLVCTGTWEGRILQEPRGANGFGYDPLFYVPSHDCTSAQLAPDVKNRLSHRAQALMKLKKRLT